MTPEQINLWLDRAKKGNKREQFRVDYVPYRCFVISDIFPKCLNLVEITLERLEFMYETSVFTEWNGKILKDGKVLLLGEQKDYTPIMWSIVY